MTEISSSECSRELLHATAEKTRVFMECVAMTSVLVTQIIKNSRLDGRTGDKIKRATQLIYQLGFMYGMLGTWNSN